MTAKEDTGSVAVVTKGVMLERSEIQEWNTS